jgi:hypothetical protein
MRWRFRGGLVLAIIVPVGALAAMTAAAAATASSTAQLSSIAAPAGIPAAPAGWSTVFSDDFNGAAGSGIDSAWKYDTGIGTSFGTGEVDTLTSSTSNVHLDGNGNLDITALNSNGAWTSGRVQTTSASVGAPAGGELEVTGSILQPAGGLGYWPALWLLGPGQWPENGEIDILEDVNSLSQLSGTLHCGIDPGGPCNEPTGVGSGLVPCPGCQSGYHTYSMILNRTNPAAESVTFSLDGKQYFTATEAQVGPATWQAAFDHSMSIIVDLAMGGAYPNGACHCTAPDGSTPSGGTMGVAYVAAYATGGTATAAPPTSGPTPTPTSRPTPTSSPATRPKRKPAPPVAKGIGHNMGYYGTVPKTP